jgi:hypothetical protein
VNPSLPSARAGQDFVAYYEQLRRDALGGAGRGRPGLTLLLRQGLAAWMQAYSCRAFAPSTHPGLSANTIQPWSADVRSQAAVILAGIVLHSRSETTV